VNSLDLKPYHKEDLVTIFCGDCREIILDLPNCDLLLTDPPYNLGKDFGNLSDKQDWGDYKIWTSFWFYLAWNMLKDSGTSYITISPHPWLVEYYLGLLPKQTRIIPWCKNTGMLHKYAKDWEWFWEIILYTHKSKEYTFNKPDGIEVRDWWMFPTPWVEHHNRWFKHPTQKPEKLFEKIILSSTNEGDLVVDPFLGSGTTAKMCKKLNRRCIGIEISEEYCEIAIKRCESV